MASLESRVSDVTADLEELRGLGEGASRPGVRLILDREVRCAQDSWYYHLGRDCLGTGIIFSLGICHLS